MICLVLAALFFGLFCFYFIFTDCPVGTLLFFVMFVAAALSIRL